MYFYYLFTFNFYEHLSLYFIMGCFILYFKLDFQNNFRFTEKLSSYYREFPYSVPKTQFFLGTSYIVTFFILSEKSILDSSFLLSFFVPGSPLGQHRHVLVVLYLLRLLWAVVLFQTCLAFGSLNDLEECWVGILWGALIRISLVPFS